MTLDEAMAKVDEVIATKMADAIDMIRNQGASEDEVESFRECCRRMIEEQRASQLVDLRAWLQRHGSTLQ
jgi:ketopantoate reductase